MRTACPSPARERENLGGAVATVWYPVEATIITQEVKLRNTVQSKREGVFGIPDHFLQLCSAHHLQYWSIAGFHSAGKEPDVLLTCKCGWARERRTARRAG